MKKLYLFFLIPTVFLPYLAIAAVLTVFLSSDYALPKYIMENVFQGNDLYLVLNVLIACSLALLLSGVFFVLSLCKRWDALTLAKTAMIIKLAQIPAYILIFVVGVLAGITIITIPFSIGLCVLDYFVLCLTGLLTMASGINALRQQSIPFKTVAWILPLQFVFCADVVTSILLYRKLKKQPLTRTSPS